MTDQPATTTPEPEFRFAHEIAWTIESDTITGKVTCRAPEGSSCRLHCDDGCDSWSWGDDREHDSLGHRLVTTACTAVSWWDMAEDLLECNLRDERLPLHDGPIAVSWEGDSWGWEYPYDATAEVSA